MSHHSPQRVNSFVLYCRENRTYLKLKYPDLNCTQITSLLAHNWKNEDEETKQQYVMKALQERVSYYSNYDSCRLMLYFLGRIYKVERVFL